MRNSHGRSSGWMRMASIGSQTQTVTSRPVPESSPQIANSWVAGKSA